MGVKTVKLTEARGQLAGARVVRDGYQVMLISTGGTVIKMPVEDVKRLGRSTQGVIVMRLREGEPVSSLAPVVEADVDGRRRRRRALVASRPSDGVPIADDDRVDDEDRGRSKTRAAASANVPFPNASGAYIVSSRGALSDRIEDAAWRTTKQVDLLEPVDLAEHLDKVELYLGQVCRLAGISKMQLDYWTNKAQIPTKGKKQRIYDMDAVETVMLIKQAQGQGPEPRRRDRRRAALPRGEPPASPAVALLAGAARPSRRGQERQMRSIGAGKTIVVELRRADLEQRLQVAQLERDRVLPRSRAPRPSAARRPGTRPRR